MLNGRAMLVLSILLAVSVVMQIVIWLFTTPIGLLVLGLLVFALLGFILFEVYANNKREKSNGSIANNVKHKVQKEERTDEPTRESDIDQNMDTATYDYIRRSLVHIEKAAKLKTTRGKNKRFTQADEIITLGLANPAVNHSLLRAFRDKHVKYNLEQEQQQ